MLNDYLEYDIATYFLNALANDDYSGLEDGEQVLFKKFLDSLPAVANSAWDWNLGETDYMVCEVCGLHSNCVRVKLRFHNPDLVK